MIYMFKQKKRVCEILHSKYWTVCLVYAGVTCSVTVFFLSLTKWLNKVTF